MTTLDALERAARAATPGEWTWLDDDDRHDTGCVPVLVKDGLPIQIADVYAGELNGSDMTIEEAEANAAFIAAANPTTILSLISDYRALQERVGGAEKALRPFADAYDKHKNRSTSEMGFAATHKAFEEARAYFAARTKAGEPHDQE